MNNNSSKQILLSVIGVAILVVAVVGVSFAFFTYTRTGDQNNQITTGSLVFSFTDGSDTIDLQNHFPVSTANGLAMAGSSEKCTFTVAGKTTAGTPLSYNVWAVPGDTDSTGKIRFKDSEVFVNIQAVADTGATFTPAMESTAASAIGNLTKDTTDDTRSLLGSGVISATNSVSTNFTVRMWVDESIVTIGDDATYTTEEYGNLYYTMKIVITANA